jgi:hypothetical protein
MTKEAKKVAIKSVTPAAQPQSIPLSEGIIKKIAAIDEQWLRVQADLNNQLKLMIECYADALDIQENQYYTLSEDKKSLLIHEK